MSVLDEAKNLVDSKFQAKQNAVTQEFRVLVRVSPGSDKPEDVRHLLDKMSKFFGDFLYADEVGTVQVVQIEPK